MATRSMPIVSWLPVSMAILQLGADAVVGRHQHRIGEAGGLEVEQAAEAADLAVRARPPRRAHQRLDPLDQGVAGVDVDAGLRVGEPVLPLAHRDSLAAVAVIAALRMNGWPRKKPGGATLDRTAAWWTDQLPGVPSCGSGCGRPCMRESGTSPEDVAIDLPNMITILRFLLVPACRLCDAGRRVWTGRLPAFWSPAFPTASTASSRAISTSAPSSAPISIRSPTSCCWSASSSCSASWGSCRSGWSSPPCRATR